ncbi:uncharacterized protein RNJ42_02484 [Nakaseomyces bracarensis]|uniref:uncharacterized protein n=1 Tax=Nakaseomyces bracarensis TaxID=273131 RepID=UPI00387230BC
MVKSSVLNNIMVNRFLVSLYSKYSYLIPRERDIGEMTKFFKAMASRVQLSKLQFKRVCCIIIKFMACCKNEMNYMQFLKYSMKRLVVTAFVLSVPNNGTDEAERSTIRDDIYSFYSKVTGLKTCEIVHCCSIVRPILIHRTREQYKAVRHRQLATGLDMDSDSDARNDINPRLTFQQPFDISSTFNFTRREHIGTVAPSSLTDSMVMNMSGLSDLDTAWRSGTGTTQQNPNNIDGNLSNDYILGSELQRFNDISYKMIHTNFKLT